MFSLRWESHKSDSRFSPIPALPVLLCDVILCWLGRLVIGIFPVSTSKKLNFQKFSDSLLWEEYVTFKFLLFLLILDQKQQFDVTEHSVHLKYRKC